MALTKVSTDGVKDDAVTTDKLANAINTERTANTAKASITINNNADNRVITGSGTANTLEGESNLTFDGTALGLTGYADVRTGSSINTNVTGGSASGTLHKNTNSGEFAIVSGGTGGNNHLTFYTSASASPTEKLRIDSSGKVGIGTSSPANKLHLNESTSGSNYIHFTNSGTGTSASDGSQVGLDGNENLVLWQAENLPMRFATNNSERLRIASNGNVGIGCTNPGQRLEVRQTNASHAIIAVNRPNSDTFCCALGNNSSGNAVISANNTDLLFGKDTGGTFTERMRMLLNGGLTFNGDTAAANAISDYEEGTWTVTDGSGAGLSFGVTQNRYTKVGRLVTCSVRLAFPSTSNGSVARVTLPFTPDPNVNSSAVGGVCLEQSYSNSVSVMGCINDNTATAIFRPNGFGSLTNATLSSKVIRFTLIYHST